MNEKEYKKQLNKYYRTKLNYERTKQNIKKNGKGKDEAIARAANRKEKKKIATNYLKKNTRLTKALNDKRFEQLKDKLVYSHAKNGEVVKVNRRNRDDINNVKKALYDHSRDILNELRKIKYDIMFELFDLENGEKSVSEVEKLENELNEVDNMKRQLMKHMNKKETMRKSTLGSLDLALSTLKEELKVEQDKTNRQELYKKMNEAIQAKLSYKKEQMDNLDDFEVDLDYLANEHQQENKNNMVNNEITSSINSNENTNNEQNNGSNDNTNNDQDVPEIEYEEIEDVEDVEDVKV
jgi:hypothetical protein